MSAANFQQCLAFTLNQEGGFVDDPYDPGGATNLGITLVTYRGYLRRPQLTAEDLRLIPAATVAAIYRTDYWERSHAAELAGGVDLMVFDMAVNAGPARSIMLLQQCLRIAEDGIVGPRTLMAAGAAPPAALIKNLASAQYWFYRGLATWNNFGRGWTARVKAREDAGTAMAANPTPSAAMSESAGA